MADEKAVQEALAADRKRVSDIRAAFPKHPEFALAQIDKGSTLLEAKVAFNDVLQAEADAAKVSQNAAEQKLADVAKSPKPAPGAAPVPLGGSPSNDSSGKHSFEVQVEERMRTAGCTRTQAMSYVCGKDRKAYLSWEREVDAKALAHMEGGNSK